MKYLFNMKPNSYFNGQDVRVEHPDSHETILVNLKDGMWAVNVKDDMLAREYPNDVRNALSRLPEAIAEALYREGTEDFWRTAQDLAQEHGFDCVYSAGRSGGWMSVHGTQDWEPTDLFKGADDPNVARFLKFAFEAQEAIDGARKYFFDRVREAMGELQLELLEYAELVGRTVGTPDGPRFKVGRLVIQYGQAALQQEDGTSFVVAKEAIVPDPFTFTLKIDTLDRTYKPEATLFQGEDLDARFVGAKVAEAIRDAGKYEMPDGEKVEPVFEITITRRERPD